LIDQPRVEDLFSKAATGAAHDGDLFRIVERGLHRDDEGIDITRRQQEAILTTAHALTRADGVCGDHGATGGKRL
jgi:hypothetical protein